MMERTIEVNSFEVGNVGGGFRVEYLDSLLQVQRMSPIANESSYSGDIHSIIDFDGVIPEGGFLDNVANLRTLSRIGKKSKTVDIHTSRFSYDDLASHRVNLDFIFGDKFQPVSNFPCLTKSSEVFLEEIVRGDKNGEQVSDCTVSFVTGLKKLVGGNRVIINKSKEVINNGDTLLMIGSSVFDIFVAKAVYSENKKNIRLGKNFFCYNTGHILI